MGRNKNKNKPPGHSPRTNNEGPRSGVPPTAAHIPTFWERVLKVWGAVMRLVIGGELEDDAKLLNDTHDLRDYGKGPLISDDQLTYSSTSESKSIVADNDRSPSRFGADQADVLKLEERLNQLEKRINKIEFRLNQAEEDPPLHPFEGRPRAAGVGSENYRTGASDSPRRSAPTYDRSESYGGVPSTPKSVDLQALDLAVCRFLADEPGAWEIDRLVNAVRLTTAGDTSIEVQHLGPHSSGEWRLVALWPQRSQEGLALVSSGELVDDDVARYFEVGFGRRIIACRQPARVSRSGDEVTVLRKGRVESS